MSIKGFKTENGAVELYDYNSLDGKLELDSTLSQTGKAADAKKVGDEISDLKDDLTQINNSNWIDGGYSLENSNFVNGTYTGTKFIYSGNTRIINELPIKVNAGSKVVITPNGNQVEWDLFDKVSDTGDYTTDFSRTSVSNWLNEETILNIAEDKYLFLIVRNSDNSNISADAMSATFTIYNSYAYINIEGLNQKVGEFDHKSLMIESDYWIDGYKVGSTGYRNSSDGSSISPFYEVKQGDVISYDLKFVNTTSWFVAFYTVDSFKASNFVSANSVPTISGIKKGVYIAPADGYVVFVNQSSYTGRIVFNNYVPDYMYDEKTFIPAYWHDSVELVINSAREKALTIGKNIVDFVFITDAHWTVNAKHSPALINKITEKLNIRNVLFGGDIITGTQSTRTLALNEVYGFFDLFDDGLNIMNTIGNHDLNNNTGTSAELTIDEAYPLYIQRAESFAVTDKNTMGAVFDNESQKVRILQFLHPTGAYVNADVTSWLMSKIAEKSGWTVIVISHAYWNSEPAGTDLSVNTVSLTLAKNIADALANANNTGFWLCGHTHRDHNTTITSDNGNTITIVCSTTDAYGYGGSDGGAEMTLGTATEQAFDIVQIDTSEHKVYMTRVGAGTDRIISY